jgi:tetratricopeptide (TPR) repeat protein
MRGQVRERLSSLMRMELVRPDQASFAGEEAYRFRHLLIRDAAYQALAKQTRSELHERFAAWLERVASERLAEYEEIIAYHLEQAYRYRIELGPPDAHGRELALRAGTLLADAGVRADARADAAATVDLLGRAVELLPADLPRRRRLMFTLGNRCLEAGDGPRAERILTTAIAEADAAGDDGASALAALGLAVVHSSMRSTEASEALRDAERLAAILARTGDETGARFAQAWAAFQLFAMGRAGEATRRARALLELGEGDELWRWEAQFAKGVSLVFGPTPIDQAMPEIQAEIDRAGAARSTIASAYSGLADLLALQGRLAEARELTARARAGWEELGNRHLLAAVMHHGGKIEQQAGNLPEAARLIRESYAAMTAAGDLAFASTVAAGLGEVLLDLGDDDETMRFATIARDTSSSDDAASQAGGRAVQARVLSRRGDHEGAEALAREAEAIMAKTDYLAQHGDVLVHLAHVLHETGKPNEALAAAREALELYQQKGATFFLEQTKRLIKSWAG